MWLAYGSAEGLRDGCDWWTGVLRGDGPPAGVARTGDRPASSGAEGQHRWAPLPAPGARNPARDPTLICSSW
eukprot:168281-Prorocentrum_minimum.AAC.1